MDTLRRSFAKFILVLFPLFICVLSLSVLAVLNYRSNVLSNVNSYSKECSIEFKNGNTITMNSIYDVYNIYHLRKIGTKVTMTENEKAIALTELFEEKIGKESYQCFMQGGESAIFTRESIYRGSSLSKENFLFTIDGGKNFISRQDIDELFKKYEQIGTLYSLLDTYILNDEIRFVYGLTREQAPERSEDATTVLEVTYKNGELHTTKHFENIDHQTTSTCYLGQSYYDGNYRSFLRFRNSGNLTSVEYLYRDNVHQLLPNIDNGGVGQICQGRYQDSPSQSYIVLDINKQKFGVLYDSKYAYDGKTDKEFEVVRVIDETLLKSEFDKASPYDISIKEIYLDLYYSEDIPNYFIRILTSNNAYLYLFFNENGALECSDRKYKKYYNASPLYNCKDLQIDGVEFNIISKL